MNDEKHVSDHQNISFVVVCEAPKFCCESGIQGDQECQGCCIPDDWINNGEKDCDNGLDEEVIGNFYLLLSENTYSN